MLDEEKIFSEEPIGINPEIAGKISKKKTGKFFRFIKKIRLFIFIFLGIIIACIASYFLLPKISLSNVTYVNTNQEVRLEKGKQVKLKTNNLSVEIVNFVKDDCPKDTTCFWSGNAVQYSMTIDGKKYATGSVTKAVDTAYDIETIDSDYESYATIKIVKNTNQ